MNHEPDRLDTWNATAPPPERPPAPDSMPPYPPSAGALIERYPPVPPMAPQYYPAEYFSSTGHPQPAVPQPFPTPPPMMNVVQQFPPGAQVVVKRSFPHGLHLVLMLITCGLWSPIWLVHYLLADNS
ncbi:hypothetical protein [Nocardia nova]|uniref:hypothetical protein n=1 Tax=Nocardia nova TaxID=37330 RepID=UPI002739CB03|nr:hypothetical protein [Nocardia nova]